MRYRDPKVHSVYMRHAYTDSEGESTYEIILEAYDERYDLVTIISDEKFKEDTANAIIFMMKMMDPETIVLEEWEWVRG